MSAPRPAATPPAPGPVRRRLSSVHRGVEVAELVVGGLLVAGVLGLVVWQAAQRYLPISGWVGSGELARYALVWLTFAVAGYLTGRGEHIGLEIVDFVVKGRLLGLIRRLADAIVALAAAAFAVDAWHLMLASTGRTSPAVGVPLAWLYLVPTIGFALTAVRAGWLAVAGHPEPVADGSDPDGTGTGPGRAA